MKKLFMVIPLVFLLCFASACQQQTDEVERIMEDGVDVVINHLEPYKIKGEPNTLHLEEEFTIDTENDDIAKTGLTEFYNFDVDSEGSIYCLNRWIGEDVVFKFDQKGNFVTSFGRRGQGPGEIMNSYDLRVDFKDEIVVKDIAGKILSFSKDGSFKKQIKGDQSLILALPLENGNYLVKKRVVNVKLESKYIDWPVFLCDSELEEIKELGKFREPRIRLGVKWGFPRNSFVFCVSGEKIFVGNSGSGYEIRVYDLAGNLKRKIRKEFQPVKVSEEYKKKEMKRFEDQVASIRNSIFFLKHNPPFQYFFTDDEGHLFVMTYEEGENPGEYMYDVFNPDGILVSRISLGNIVRVSSIHSKVATARNRRLYCIKEKESGSLELVAYKMKWE